jgi:archaellum component FlaF (FlaF/FlaG flagellin family)
LLTSVIRAIVACCVTEVERLDNSSGPRIIRNVKRVALASAVLIALLAAGGGSAYALRTIFLSPGHCKKVHGTKVCARKARTVTHTSTVTQTSTVTVTVAPTSTGQQFSGNGSETLPPMTIPANGVVVQWTAQPDPAGDNFFSVTSSPSDANFIEFDNGSGATSGSSFIPGGTYTFEVSASATWTLSF